MQLHVVTLDLFEYCAKEWLKRRIYECVLLLVEQMMAEKSNIQQSNVPIESKSLDPFSIEQKLACK